METITIRKAHDKDAKAIVEIINILKLDMSEFVWSDIDFVRKQISQGEYFVAQVADAVVGIISLRQRKKVIHIETLAVLPGHRLKKIGTRLVDFAKQFTKEKELKDLCACSFLEYHIGDFYHRQGFSLLPKPGEYQGRKYHIFVTKVA